MEPYHILLTTCGTVLVTPILFVVFAQRKQKEKEKEKILKNAYEEGWAKIPLSFFTQNKKLLKAVEESWNKGLQDIILKETKNAQYVMKTKAIQDNLNRHAFDGALSLITKDNK
jgi:hypothetical protein